MRSGKTISIGVQLRQVILALVLLLIIQTSSVTGGHAQESTTQVPSATSHDCQIVHKSTPIILQCSITPSEEAYVDNLFPSKVFDDMPMLIVQNTPSVPVGKNYAFLKFDLTTNLLPSDLVASNAKPTNESLRMYVRLISVLYNATVEIHATVNADWNEHNITWNNMPQFDTANYVSANIRRNGTWARWNLANLPETAVSTGRNLTLVAVSNETAWKNLVWFDSKEYPYANGTTTPTLELTYVEPSLTIETPYPNLPVRIGGTVINTGSDGKAQAILPWGRYEITVPDVVPISNGTRAHFLNWDDNTTESSRLIPLGSNITLHAAYGVEHALNVYSAYGTTNGSGWYLDHSYANLSVSPTSVPVEGFLGWLGERYVFDHWTGASNSNEAECTVLMDAPKDAQAVWRTDWTTTEVALLVFALFSALVAFYRRNRRTGSKKRRVRRA